MICYHNNDNRDFGGLGMMPPGGSAGDGAGGWATDFAPPDRLRALNGVAMFEGLPMSVKKSLARRLDWRAYAPGSVIVGRRGDADAVFFLVSGTAEVVNHAEPDRRVTRAALGPGDVFGELAAIDPGARSSAVIAMTECVAGQMPPDVFLGLVGKYERPALAFMGRLAKMIRAANQTIENLIVMNARQRVAFEINRLAEAGPGGDSRRVIDPAPTQGEIAETIGLSRQTVPRWFGELMKGGVIERRGRTIAILDSRRLRRIIEDGK